VVGSQAVQIAFGPSIKQATPSALQEIASHAGGMVLLRLLAAGFAGLTLWRLTEAAYGRPGPAGARRSSGCCHWRSGFMSLAFGVFCGVVRAGVVSFILGTGGRKPAGNTPADDVHRHRGYVE
jgi:Domain of Unknown Function (DUF1206)